MTLEESLTENLQLKAQLAARTALLAEREREIEKLTRIIESANKKLYGSKSEKLTSDQIRFTFNQPEPLVQQSLEQEVTVEKHTRTVRKGRQPLPSDLPREQVVYEPEATHCSCCNHELVTIGEEKSEELEKIPAQLKVIEHIRIKKACPACKGAGVLVPPLPPTALPLDRARPGAGLLADITVSKYVDHLPLHRQEQMFLRQGIELPRQRMCDWIAAEVELLLPLYEALRSEILSLPYVPADETTLKVQDGETPGKCHTGYLWGLLGPPNRVWFHYAPSRAGEVIKTLLKDYNGVIQTDAYAGYNKVLLPGRCQRIACLAHVRRKFIEAQSSAGKECGKVLALIADLYKAEKPARSADARLELRQGKSGRIMLELFACLKDLNSRILPQSALASAVRYTLDQEDEILRILENGAYELDNNRIEREMRPIAVGRKNYLFAGSHDGARRAAVLYSFFGTCRLNKVNPWAWLSDVLRRIGSDRTVKAADLLPHNWKTQG